MGGISWIRRSELTTHRDKMNFLTSIITLHAVVQSSQAQVVHAAPVLSTPALATAGYAVGASGAVGGQAPVVLSTAPITPPLILLRTTYLQSIIVFQLSLSPLRAFPFLDITLASETSTTGCMEVSPAHMVSPWVSSLLLVSMYTIFQSPALKLDTI